MNCDPTEYYTALHQNITQETKKKRKKRDIVCKFKYPKQDIKFHQSNIHKIHKQRALSGVINRKQRFGIPILACHFQSSLRTH
uniref:Uncharacterized protein n=1 Tax=Cucumis melo TaxID=3656 RepID=A0A9I9EAH6_CUCME